MNTTTPRIFIAATGQNEGKTTTSLGLLATLQRHFPRVGYIKPVGQRFVRVDDRKIDEDTVLMDQVYNLDCPLRDMSPLAVGRDFTRRFIEGEKSEELVQRICSAFDRVAWEKDFVLCEGSGHAGVGSVFDLSNARVAKILGAKVIMVSEGGIGRPIDELSLNQALFEREGVEIAGVILNKVVPDKMDFIADITRRGLKRKGLELLGVMPLQPELTRPTMDLIREELGAETLNSTKRIDNPVKSVVVGAMAVDHAVRAFKRGALLITPGDREDIVKRAAAAVLGKKPTALAGVLLTAGFKLDSRLLDIIDEMPFPVLSVTHDSYEAAARVHGLIVKTRPADTKKIRLIRDLVARHVDVERIVNSV